MKKFLIAFVSVFLVFGLNKAFSQNFYTGDGGKGQKFVIGKNEFYGANDKKDSSLPSKIKDDFIYGVANPFSAIEIGEEEDNEENKRLLEKREGNEYESDLDAPSFIQTDKRITIKTTLMASGNYEIQVIVKSIKKSTTEFSVKSPEMSFAEAQSKGGATVAYKFLERLGVKLTAAGKNSLLPGSVELPSSIKNQQEMWNQTIAAQNAQSEKLEQEIARLRAKSVQDAKVAAEIARKELAQKRAQAQATLAKERLERLEEQARAEAVAEKKRQDMDAKYLEQISEIQRQAEEKASEIRLKSASVLSAIQKIENIEQSKQSLASFWKEITDGIKRQNSDLDKSLQEEIEAKTKSLKKRFARLLDKNGNFPDELLDSVLKEIEPQQKSNAQKKEENQLQQMQSADSLKIELSKYIEDLKNSTNTADSLISDSALSLLFSEFDTNSNTWKYKITLSIGAALWIYEGKLSFKEVTGKEPIRKGATLDEWEEYNNEIGKYEIMLNTGSPVIHAQLKYKIQPKENSKYKLEVQSLKFFDLEKGDKVVKIENLSESQKSKELYYEPATNVNLMSAQEILAAKKKENKQVNEILKKLGYDYGVVEVKGGTFKMGREGGADDEKPVHYMTVGDFEMLATEVTEKLYDGVMKSAYNRYNVPKVQITLFAAMDFCNKLSEICGLEPAYIIKKNEKGGNTYYCNFVANGFRLPTETEWEYAALGGIYNAKYTIGNPLKTATSEEGWFKENSSNRLQNVAQKEKSALGLYDMLGNAAEWCWDPYSKDSYKNAKPYGVSVGDGQVVRGGSYEDNYYSPFQRNSADPNYGSKKSIGFRIIRPTGIDIELSKKKPLANFKYPSPSSSSSSSYSGSSSSYSSSYSSKSWLFPLYGIELGKTSVSELQNRGTKAEEYDYYKINGQNFWYENGVFDHMYVTYDGWISEWTAAGYDKNLSYNDWLSFLKSQGYEIFVTKNPTYKKYDWIATDSLSAEIAAIRAYPVKHGITLHFDYSGKTSLSAKGTLYSIRIDCSLYSYYLNQFPDKFSSSSSSSSSSYSGSASYSRSSSSSSSSSSSGSFFSNLSTQNRVSDAFGIGYTWIGNDRFSANGVFVNFTSFHKGPLFFDIGDIIMAGGDGSFFFSMGPRLGLYKGIKRLFLDVHTGAGFYVLSYPEKEKTSSSSSAWDSGYSGYSSSSSKDIDDSAGGFYLKLGAGVEFKLTNYVKATFDYDVYFTFGADPVAADNIRLGICFGQPVYK